MLSNSTTIYSSNDSIAASLSPYQCIVSSSSTSSTTTPKSSSAAHQQTNKKHSFSIESRFHKRYSLESRRRSSGCYSNFEAFSENSSFIQYQRAYQQQQKAKNSVFYSPSSTASSTSSIYRQGSFDFPSSEEPVIVSNYLGNKNLSPSLEGIQMEDLFNDDHPTTTATATTQASSATSYNYASDPSNKDAIASYHHSSFDPSNLSQSRLPPNQALPSQSASLDRHSNITAATYHHPEPSPIAYDNTYLPPQSNYTNTTPSGSSSTRSSISQPYFNFQQQLQHHHHSNIEQPQQHQATAGGHYSGSRKIYHSSQATIASSSSTTTTPRSPPSSSGGVSGFFHHQQHQPSPHHHYHHPSSSGTSSYCGSSSGQTQSKQVQQQQHHKRSVTAVVDEETDPDLSKIIERLLDVGSNHMRDVVVGCGGSGIDTSNPMIHLKTEEEGSIESSTVEMDQKHSPDSGASMAGNTITRQQQQQPSCSILPVVEGHQQQIKSEPLNTSQQSTGQSSSQQRLHHQIPPPEAQLPEESTSSRLPYQNFFGITSPPNSSNFFGHLDFRFQPSTMSNDFMQQHQSAGGASFKTEFNPNDINVSQYSHYSQGLFGHSNAATAATANPFYSQPMSQQQHQQQQQQTNEMESRRSSQGTTNRNWTGADLMQFNPMSLFSASSNVSQTNTPSPLNLHGNSSAFSSSSAAAAQQLARLGSSGPFGAIRGINMDVATSSGLAAVAAAAFEAAHAQMPGMGQLAPEEHRLCAVCNDQARGRHYGIYSCEGCKGFFKRSIQNERAVTKRQQYVCAGNKNCPIDKRYRSRCQYCRYQKCLAVGMVKEVVRCGPLQGRRGRMPSKARASMLMGDQPQSPQLPILMVISKIYAELRPQVPSSRPIVTRQEPVSAKEMVDILNLELQSIYTFLAKIPDIGDLSDNDMRVLLSRNFFALLAIKHAHRMADLKLDNTFLFENGIAIPLNNIPMEFSPLFNAIIQESPVFHAVEFDAQTLPVLLVLQFLNFEEDRVSIAEHSRIHRIHSTIINALKDHCCAGNNPNDNKLSKIISQASQFHMYRGIGFSGLYRILEASIQLPPMLEQLYQEFCKQNMTSSSSSSSTTVVGGSGGGDGGKMQHQQQSSGILPNEIIMQQSGAKMGFPFNNPSAFSS